MPKRQPRTGAIARGPIRPNDDGIVLDADFQRGVPIDMAHQAALAL
jgi:hypothetical protein